MHVLVYILYACTVLYLCVIFKTVYCLVYYCAVGIHIIISAVVFFDKNMLMVVIILWYYQYCKWDIEG